jgi:hypothetical protein
MISERKRERYFSLNCGPTLDGRATASKPLDVVQSDCWDVPIYLVHPISRQTVGRAMLVQGKETTCHLVPAWALTWEHDGSVAVPLLLESLVAGNSRRCELLGIDYDPSSWPCQGYMCQTLLSDSERFIAQRAKSIKRALGIEILSTGASGRDLRRVVETGFDDLYERVIKALPGALPPRAISPADPVDQHAQRTAALDIFQMERLIAGYYISHNRFRRLKDQSLSGVMEGNVKPTPLELWDFGILQYGRPAPLSLDMVRITCLERARATVTRNGIRLGDGLYYDSVWAQREGWFSSAALGHSRSIDVVFDRRNMERIFFVPDERSIASGRRVLEDCWRVKSKSELPYLHLEDIKFERARQKAERNRCVRPHGAML